MVVLGNSLGIVKGDTCSLHLGKHCKDRKENTTEFSLHLLGFSVPDATIGSGGTGRIEGSSGLLRYSLIHTKLYLHIII